MESLLIFQNLLHYRDNWALGYSTCRNAARSSPMHSKWLYSHQVFPSANPIWKTFAPGSQFTSSQTKHSGKHFFQRYNRWDSNATASNGHVSNGYVCL